MMDVNKAEIKQQNRKAMPKFIVIMTLSVLIGGAFGFCTSYYGLNGFAGKLTAAGTYFSSRMAHWLLPALALVQPAVCLPLYFQGKRMVMHWDGEDDAAAEKAEEKLSIVMWISGAAMITANFLIAAAYAAGHSIFTEKGGLLALCVSIAAFFGILFENVLFQQKVVDMTKRLYPEKTASVYDVRFRKKWLDSCDEAEKAIIGQCAYKAYAAANHLCSALAAILAISALVFGTGALPSLAVCAVWMVMQCVYSREAMRLSRAGSQITE